MTKEQAKEEVKKTGIKKGYRLDHPEDWYEGLTNDDLMEYIDNRKIRHLFRDINSIIIELFPTLLEWKFKRMANGWWDKEENFLKFIKWSKKHVWTKPEDLYNVDSNIIDIYSSVLKSKYNIHELSKILYPEYEFLPFLFKKNKKEWWDDINNQIIFLKWLEKRLGWNKPEDWYKIKSDNENALSNIIARIYTVLFAFTYAKKVYYSVLMENTEKHGHLKIKPKIHRYVCL